MKKLHKSLIIFLAVALVSAAFAGCGSSGSDKVNVNTVAVKKQALDSGISVTGVLLPASTVNVASKLAGSFQVTAVNVEVGSTVKKGDTLATLDTTQLEAQLAQAEAQLNAANVAKSGAKSGKSTASSSYNSLKKSYETAKKNLASAQALYNSLIAPGSGATADQITNVSIALQTAQSAYNYALTAYTQAKSGTTTASNAFNSAEASIDVAQAGLDLVNVQLANATLTSPVDGIVISKNVNVGEMAAPSVALFTVADESTLKLKSTISQEALPSISEGQSVDVSVDIYPGTAYTGTITLIAPIAVSTGGYFPIEISLPSASGLKPGLSASASIKVTGASNIIVPISAVKTENGVSFVFVLKDGAAVKREVKTGLSNTNSIEILSGLEVGESVITSNVSILSDGMQVNEQNGEHTAD